MSSDKKGQLLRQRGLYHGRPKGESGDFRAVGGADLF